MDKIWQKALELEEEQRAFAVVTVVRSEKPTSAIVGSKAIISTEGKMIGFVGGQCTQSLVVSQALECIEIGQSKLLLITSKANRNRSTEGMEVLPMTCQSEGTVELFIEPKLPKATLLVIGDSPIAHKVTALAEQLEQFNIKSLSIEGENPNTLKERLQELLSPNSYVVIATMGLYDEASIVALKGIELRYLGLIASPKRTGKVLEALKDEGASEEFLSFISAPAGLDLKAITPGEIAVTVIAEIIQNKRSGNEKKGSTRLEVSEQKKTEVVDPVCKMVVDLNKTSYKTEYDGIEYGFCCPNCRRSFLKNPKAYLQKIES